MIRASAKASDFSEGSPDRLSDVSWARTAELTPVPMSAPVTRSDSDRVRMIEASFKPAKSKSPIQIVSAPVRVTKKPVASAAPPKGTVILDAESGALAPSFIGRTVRAAIEQAQRAGLEIEIVGSGVARQQVPAPGEAIPPGTRITVEFSR
jgi:cell division protein FtsI (penicillin-binding protein 3)